MLRKKLTITILFFLVPVLLTAQPLKPKVNKAPLKSGHELVTRTNADQKASLLKVSTVSGDVIGYTYYDYMTNGGLGDRIIWFEDQTIMVGTMASDNNTGTGGAGQRGSYYQYYNDTNWLDTAATWNRVETARRGWTTIGAFYSDKTAVLFSHVAAELNINFGTPEAPAWTPQVVPGTAGFSWPKMAVDDAEGTITNIYAIGGESSGLPVPFVRSTDAGSTWEDVKILADTNTAAWQEGYIGVGADDAVVTARGGKVAVFNFTTQGNCVLYKSEDQGVTFTSTTLLDAMALDAGLATMPWDSTINPTSYVMTGVGYPDGTGDVHIDANGKIHVAWGNYQLGYSIEKDTLGNPVRVNGALQPYWFVSDFNGLGLSYWNEDMSAPVYIKPPAKGYDMSFATLADDGTPTTLNAGLDVSSMGMPTIGSDAAGNIYIVYQGFAANDVGDLTAEGVTSTYPFGHVYMTKSTDNGATWATPADIYGDNVTGEDVLFPSIPDRIWDQTKIPVLVQNDQSPGTWLQQGDHPQNRNLFIVTRFDASGLTVGVNDEVADLSYSLDQNYPNPFNPSTAITFSVPEAGNVSLKVYDMLGREVATLINGSMNAGSHTVNFNANNLATGMYMYTLKTENFTSSKKMLLLK